MNVLNRNPDHIEYQYERDDHARGVSVSLIAPWADADRAITLFGQLKSVMVERDTLLTMYKELYKFAHFASTILLDEHSLQATKDAAWQAVTKGVNDFFPCEQCDGPTPKIDPECLLCGHVHEEEKQGGE